MRSWVSGPAHDASRSLSIVRVAVALILITHPIHALLHHADISGFGRFLASRGLPMSTGLAWAVMFLQIGCSSLLLVRRLVLPACVGHIVILSLGIILVHAPKWRTVGLPDGEHQPGSEFSVLLIACLFGVLWANRVSEGSSPSPRDTASTRFGLEIVRLATPLILIIHPLGGLLDAFRDPKDMNDLGLYFSSIGYPFGVALVWGAMYLQLACCIALIARRFVVPACLGNIYVLCTGIWLFHAPHWFVIGPNDVIGPGHEGAEYSTLLISCFFSLILAFWPQQQTNDRRFRPASSILAGS